MAENIKLRKGFDIHLAGAAERQLGECLPAATYALKPTDFAGMTRPKLFVKEGDDVKAGTPTLMDKMPGRCDVLLASEW